jgi:hypothetical protein
MYFNTRTVLLYALHSYYCIDRISVFQTAAAEVNLVTVVSCLILKLGATPLVPRYVKGV